MEINFDLLHKLRELKLACRKRDYDAVERWIDQQILDQETNINRALIAAEPYENEP